jgi:hypothetical protein
MPGNTHVQQKLLKLITCAGIISTPNFVKSHSLSSEVTTKVTLQIIVTDDKVTWKARWVNCGTSSVLERQTSTQLEGEFVQMRTLK